MTKRENPRRKDTLEQKKRREYDKSQRRREMRAEFVPNESEMEGMEDLVLGRNAAMEVLKSNRTIECLYVSKGDLEGSIKAIIGLAKEKNIVIKEVDRRKLDSMANGLNHQGVIVRVTAFEYCEVNEILEAAAKKNEEPFIVILDEIEDPHNLGSIIRTAELCGAHGIISRSSRAYENSKSYKYQYNYRYAQV